MMEPLYILFAFALAYTFIGCATGLLALKISEEVAVVAGAAWPLGLPIVAGYLLGRRLTRRRVPIPQATIHNIEAYRDKR